jgi:hypothetical protein
MKMRKLISLVLALALVFSLAAPVMAAAPTDQEKAGDRLLELGIIAGDASGELQLDKTLTRAEVTVLLARLNGMGHAAELLHNQPSVFSDVKTGEWYTGWINLASSQGWIKGDPQGTFRPNDPVQYREAVTMIVKVLGYDDNLIGAWPTNYLAKATTLGLVKDLAYTDAKASAVRGDIFLVASRALDEKVVYWSNSEQEYLYRESKDAAGKISTITLLENALNLVKISEVTVTSMPMIDSSLKADQVKLSHDNRAYTLKVGNPLDYYGKEVTVWLDSAEKEIVAIQVDTAAGDIYMDTVKEATGSNVTLQVADKKLDFAKDPVIYVNGKAESASSSLKDTYGRFVLDDRGDVKYAVLFSFSGKGVVTDVEDEVATYVNANNPNRKSDKLDLKDYKKGAYVFDQDLNEIDFDSIEEGSGLFFGENAKGDIAYVLVNDEAVEGKLERVNDNNVRIDGTNYGTTNSTIFTADNGSNYSRYSVADVEVLINYDVEAVLDLAGKVLLLSGSSDEKSGTQYGVVTHASRAGSANATIYTSEGKNVDYKFADRDDMPASIVYKDDNFDYYGADGALKYALIKYQVDKDGNIHSSFDKKGAVVRVENATPAIGNISVVSNPDNATIHWNTASKSSNKDYIDLGVGVGAKRFYFNEKTTIMSTINSSGKLKPSTVSYDSLYSNTISAANDNSMAVVFGDPGKVASAIFFVQKGFKGVDEPYKYGVLTSDPLKDKNDWYAEIDVLGEGVIDVKLASEENLAKGSVIAYRVNNQGKAEVYGAYNVKTGKSVHVAGSDYGSIIKPGNSFATVADISGNHVKIGTTWYLVEDDVVVYQLKSDNSVEKEASYSNVDTGRKVVMLINKDGKVAAILLAAKDAGPGPISTAGTVTYINVDENLIEVDDKVLELDKKVRLLNADKETIAIGKDAVVKALKKGDILEDIKKDKDGLVTEMKLAKEKEPEEPEEITVTGEEKDYVIFKAYEITIKGVSRNKVEKVTVNGNSEQFENSEDASDVIVISPSKAIDTKADKVVVIIDGKEYDVKF